MQNNWFKNLKKSDCCKSRLFCFHHAGGSSDVFKNWSSFLPESMELYAMQLPGRGVRFKEPLIDDMSLIVEQAADAIIPMLDIPYVMLGHSLGGALAFDLVKRLRRLGQDLPANLFIISMEGPKTPCPNPKYHASDSELIEYLRLQSGTNDNVLKNSELTGLLLPIVRSDLKLANTYFEVCQHEEALTCPIHVFWGTEEIDLKQEHVDDWKRESKNCTIDRFSGNHFFLHENTDLVVKKMLQYIGYDYE